MAAVQGEAHVPVLTQYRRLGLGVRIDKDIPLPVGERGIQSVRICSQGLGDLAAVQAAQLPAPSVQLPEKRCCPL